MRDKNYGAVSCGFHTMTNRITKKNLQWDKIDFQSYIWNEIAYRIVSYRMYEYNHS